MSDIAFDNYAQQLDFLQLFQLEILRKKIDSVIASRKKTEDSRLKNDMALFEHFSGLGEGIDAETSKKEYFEEKYGCFN